MLPSISSGHFGIASKPVYGSNSVHGISIVNKPLQDSFDEEDRSVNCPSLPLISEGSFTSLLSKKSGKAVEKCKDRVSKDDEITGPGADTDMRSCSGLKTTRLQLNCELKNADRGWFPKGLNPRLANSSRPSQLPTMGLHMMSTSERLLLQQSLGKPVESLHKRKQQSTADGRKGYLMTLGGQTVLNSRYRIPVVSSIVSPSKEAPAIPSYAPESTSVNMHKRSANKPVGVAVHSRCCCRHHKHSNEQRETLKSRSSESLCKERVYRAKKEGYVISQSNHGNTSSNERKVNPTDRPPPKKLSTPNAGIFAAQPKRKSKRIHLLASDSSSSLQEERKRGKKSIPKQTRQKCPKSPEQKSTHTELIPRANPPVEESPEEFMIYIENDRENPSSDGQKEVDELMDVEYNGEEKELDSSTEQLDGLDVMSVRSSTACDPQRSTTPRLLKVTSEVQFDPALSAVFRKLDTDCDGHISFTELKRSLPQNLTRQQINYVKKIYGMACESTYFGLEEFTATHQMCSLLAQSSPLVSDASSNLDSSIMDAWLGTFMESFSKADKHQSGVIDIQSFENMLASVISVHPDSFVIQKILGNLGKLKAFEIFQNCKAAIYEYGVNILDHEDRTRLKKIPSVALNYWPSSHTL